MSKPKEIITACRWSPTNEKWVGCPPGEVPPAGPPLPGEAMRRYMLPSGVTGRVITHRSYRMPSGRFSVNPLVANVTAEYIKKWVPAYYTATPPIGTRGSWVQLSKGDLTIGVLHTQGFADRMVTVLGLRNGHALVRHRADAVPNPVGGNTSTSQNTNTVLVSTRRSRRDRAATLRAPGGAGLTPGEGLCKAFPWMKKCKEIQAPCPAGYEYVEATGTCAATGNPSPNPTVKCNKLCTDPNKPGFGEYFCCPKVTSASPQAGTRAGRFATRAAQFGNPKAPPGMKCPPGEVYNPLTHMCEPADIFYPHPPRANRSAMIRAAQFGGKTQKCPKGMIWDEKAQACKWPKIVLVPDELPPHDPKGNNPATRFSPAAARKPHKPSKTCPPGMSWQLAKQNNVIVWKCLPLPKAANPEQEVGPLGRLEIALRELFAGRARVAVGRKGIEVLNPGCIPMPEDAYDPSVSYTVVDRAGVEALNPGCC